MADSNVPFPNSPESTIVYDRRDAITDGMIDLLKPTVEEIDDRVKTVRESQVELRQQIDCLAEDLQVISGSQTVAVDLESYVKKLNNSRRRVMLVNNILQNVQERLTKLYNNVSRETARRKALLDPPGAGRPK
ncbi:SNARE-associated protein Snapin-like [Mercenaria mercenaria]|uniref:SNARE-associated protein Snapin-like n=1 Tax=Mercenaria mercenaria TaxID=6596 RepID=UPI001E1D7CD4|nr:SNARE-associated protein Snapin-like [Mercenaria mercenaria]